MTSPERDPTESRCVLRVLGRTLVAILDDEENHEREDDYSYYNGEVGEDAVEVVKEDLSVRDCHLACLSFLLSFNKSFLKRYALTITNAETKIICESD